MKIRKGARKKKVDFGFGKRRGGEGATQHYYICNVFLKKVPTLYIKGTLNDKARLYLG
mgnify:CR=1 FL=1